MFDTEQFIADCRSALAADESPRLVREVVARAVADPAAIHHSCTTRIAGCGWSVLALRAR